MKFVSIPEVSHDYSRNFIAEVQRIQDEDSLVGLVKGKVKKLLFVEQDTRIELLQCILGLWKDLPYNEGNNVQHFYALAESVLDLVYDGVTNSISRLSQSEWNQIFDILVVERFGKPILNREPNKRKFQQMLHDLIREGFIAKWYGEEPEEVSLRRRFYQIVENVGLIEDLLSCPSGQLPRDILSYLSQRVFNKDYNAWQAPDLAEALSYGPRVPLARVLCILAVRFGDMKRVSW